VLEHPDVWNDIKAVGENFCPNAALCQGYLLELKTLPSEWLVDAEGSKRIWVIIELCIKHAVGLLPEIVDLRDRLLEAILQAILTLGRYSSENDHP
jgi:hypothetical protein